MTVLLLGGTADGRVLAERLHQQGVAVIYSVAGLIRQPDLPCSVISGGFSGSGGLLVYVQRSAITAIVDATHAYASNISHCAAQAAQQAGIPYWRVERPAWQAQAGDRWQFYDALPDMLVDLRDKRSVLFAVGYIQSDFLQQLVLMAGKEQRQIVRAALESDDVLPDSVHWIKEIGPYAEQNEWELMKQYQVDALVCKNSGGDAMYAKLGVARALKVPVLMLARPELPRADQLFTQLDECEQRVLRHARSLITP